ncbi:MAG: pentapeptide repeat-containing protein [Candidatus Peribacteraceae bacterium]|nr:pentapeptide repeat-containing protein [Candidatus Peribacteraceae bacterium]
MESFDAVVGKKHITGEYFLQENEILDYPWKKTTFNDARVSGGSMTASLFEDCIFKNTTFEHIYLDDVDFVRCHFENFKIINCSHDAMEIRECTGSPPTIIGTKEPRSGSRNMTFPPGWEPAATDIIQ